MIKATDLNILNHLEVLDTLANLIYSISESKGFKEKEYDISVHLMNLNSETSELWEAYRNNKLEDPCDKPGLELTCKEEEIADILIRTLDTVKTLDIDIVKAVKAKILYNLERSHMHGGKIC